MTMESTHGSTLPPSDAELRSKKQKTGTLNANNDQPDDWPDLPLDQWKETYATLHMWTQIVGKIRLAFTP